MAGTLVITTLSDGTNSTSATNCIQGSAKAWVQFNGTGAVAVRNSYNVSSITDHGTGNFTINFTNAMPNANYVLLGSTDYAGVISEDTINVVRTTTAIRIFTTQTTNASPVDYGNNSVAILSS
jgi:hypothetical protein